MYWKRQADKSFRCANYDEASRYYNLGVKHSPEQSPDIKGACYEALADVCFKQGKFLQCVECGEKANSVKVTKNEVRFF